MGTNLHAYALASRLGYVFQDARGAARETVVFRAPSHGLATRDLDRGAESVFDFVE